MTSDSIEYFITNKHLFSFNTQPILTPTENLKRLTIDNLMTIMLSNARSSTVDSVVFGLETNIRPG